ncbi:MAG: hypothetical protein GEU97_08235 [Actinophytocola sp.]|nr:hypothetical protein [Actinophytocola sp.]
MLHFITHHAAIEPDLLTAPQLARVAGAYGASCQSASIGIARMLSWSLGRSLDGHLDGNSVVIRPLKQRFVMLTEAGDHR